MFRQSSFGEDGLHLWNDSGRYHSAGRADRVGLLADARHYGKVVREVRCQDARYSLLIELFGALEIYKPAASPNIISETNCIFCHHYYYFFIIIIYRY